MNLNSKIFIAGHEGLVGSALLRLMKKNGYHNILTRTFSKLDLRNQNNVHTFFKNEKPEYVFLAAAQVGGIKANSCLPASFIYNNLLIEANVIHSAYIHGTKKLLFLGSSCIYPRFCPQPIKEDYFLSGSLETTNKPYAVAKIAGIILCESYNTQYGTCFISCMPTNLYGPYDNFEMDSAHVIPALIAKIEQATRNKESSVSLWGNGTSKREFLYVDDAADAFLFLMHHYHKSTPINVGVGKDITIFALAQLIKKIIGYQGKIIFNQNGLDGTPQKVLNIEKLNAIGWRASITLKEGIERTYKWYLNNKDKKILCTLHKKLNTLNL